MYILSYQFLRPSVICTCLPKSPYISFDISNPLLIRLEADAPYQWAVAKYPDPFLAVDPQTVQELFVFFDKFCFIHFSKIKNFR